MSLLSSLRKMICKEPTINPFNAIYHRSGDRVRTALRKAYPSAQIRIADDAYATTSLDEFNKWLQNDCVSTRKYYAEWNDCDNYARALRCAMFKINQYYQIEITMAYCEGMDGDGTYHAFNTFIDSNDIVYIVEPQNDSVVIYSDSKYKPDFIQL